MVGWWSCVIKQEERTKSADTLSRSPLLPPPQVGIVDSEVQVASVSSTSLSSDPEDMEATVRTSHSIPASERDKEDEIPAVGVAKKTERSDGEGTARVEDSMDQERWSQQDR